MGWKNEVKTIIPLTKINASINVDKKLYVQDIKGSIAHCKMLVKQKIIKKTYQIKL